MKFGSSNVVFRKMNKEEVLVSSESSTYKGIALKTLFFLLMTVIGAAAGIALAFTMPEVFVVLLAISGLLTLIFSIVALVSPRLSKVFGTLYCLAEGMLVGVLSVVCEALVGGAVSIALLSTIAVFGVVCILYVSNIVKVNNKFMKFLSLLAISYIIGMIIFYIYTIFVPEINIGLSLLISAITIFLACLYLFFDLENIRQVVEGGYDKKYEWVSAFGLAFTLIWLYVEILQLVIKIAAIADRS